MKKDMAQLMGDKLWVHFAGRTFSVDAGSGRRARKKSAGGGSSDQVVAPMPGKITKLLVQEGDVIVAGQALVMMEAMKMEYTLKADIAGEIEKISCGVGEQVALGKALVKIKAQG